MNSFLLVLIDWVCVFAFVALLVEVFLGAVALVERWRR